MELFYFLLAPLFSKQGPCAEVLDSVVVRGIPYVRRGDLDSLFACAAAFFPAVFGKGGADPDLSRSSRARALGTLHKGRFLVTGALSAAEAGAAPSLRLGTQVAVDFVEKEQNGCLSQMDLARLFFLETEADPLTGANLSLKRLSELPKKNAESPFFEILRFWRNKAKESAPEGDSHKDFFSVQRRPPKRPQSPGPSRPRKRRKGRAKPLSLRRFSLERLPGRAPVGAKRKAPRRSHSFEKPRARPPKKAARGEADWGKVLRGERHLRFVFEQIAASGLTREAEGGSRSVGGARELQQKGHLH